MDKGLGVSWRITSVNHSQERTSLISLKPFLNMPLIYLLRSLIAVHKQPEGTWRVIQDKQLIVDK
ncbi:CLUMA_CG017918, isoform A [Clunio marinus]|uniref:CLUMA_CG017918, isoform A n=1 Tax=Clunio marinus TaxID=568069 RepID=A0A1J1J1Y4_9DIPT|nr:CLUMA_CG017918, isoform A [Clunio marinus]